MLVEKNAPLRQHNSFGISARADTLVRVRSLKGLEEFAASDIHLAPNGHRRAVLALGGGSNIVFCADVVNALVLKMEIGGIELVKETPRQWIIEAGAGVLWHDLVCWTLEHGMWGLENLALIPGTVGAAPVQNIGAYGLELQDRFESLEALDLESGRWLRLNAQECAFGYRDSVFKRGLRGRAVVGRVRLALPKSWRAELGYQDLQRQVEHSGIDKPSAQQIFEWVCDIRRAKLPDPALMGNAGSFFKNPIVSDEECRDILEREPQIVHYPLLDGRVKLAAGWMIDACGWKGKTLGRAGVHRKQALVLINAADDVTGAEVLTLAQAIQTSVYERFGVHLEPEPELIFSSLATGAKLPRWAGVAP